MNGIQLSDDSVAQIEKDSLTNDTNAFFTHVAFSNDDVSRQTPLCSLESFLLQDVSVMTVIHCGFLIFELITTVMEINSLAGYFFGITDFVLVFLNRDHHTTANTSTTTKKRNEDNTYCHMITHAHTNTSQTHHKHITKNHKHTKHNTHFQHRCRPTSFQVARGLHSYTRTVVSCMMRACSADQEWAKVHAL